MTSSARAANVAYRNGNPTQAEILCRQALAADEGDADAYLLLGILLSRSGRLDEAIPALTSSVTSDPRLLDGWLWLSTTFRRLSRFDEAAEAGRRAVALAPKSADAYSKLGQALMLQDRFGEAKDALESSCRLDPRVAATQSNLAFVYWRLGLESDAERGFRAAIALAPTGPSNRIKLSRLLLTLQRNEEAAEEARQGLRHAPNDPELHLLLARALLAEAVSGDADEKTKGSEAHLRRTIQLNPTSGEAYAMLGMLLQNSARFEEAVPFLEKSISLEPNQGLSYLGLVRGRRLTTKDRKLIDQIKAIVERGSVSGRDLSLVYYALGKAYEDLQEFEPAMSAFDSANAICYAGQRAKHPFDREGYARSSQLARSAFTNDALASPGPAPALIPIPILIVGVMRSGTTLLEQILSSHPKVAACGELSFWQDRGPALYEPAGGTPSKARVQALAREYVETLRAASSSDLPYATDKRPHNYRLLGLFHLAFPTAPIIYIKRNAVDTCLSIYVTPYSVAPEFAHDKSDIAFVYEEHLKLMQHWRSALPPGRIIEVNYEELIQDHESVVRRLLDSCGLEWDEACLQHHKNARVVLTPSVWQVRQPIYTSSVNRRRGFEAWLREFAHLEGPWPPGSGPKMI